LIVDWNEVKNLDLSNIGTSSLPIRIIVIALMCAAIGFAGYWFDTKKQIVDLKVVETKEVELKQTFETKQKKAANLELYKEQLAEMRRTFGALLRQLPSETEIPGLIVDISQTGLSSGLEIELFKPMPEVKKDFYAEKPIELRVKGNYHQFGEFASGLAALPRIVTLENVELKPGEPMTMSATAKTYRYLEGGE